MIRKLMLAAPALTVLGGLMMAGPALAQPAAPAPAPAGGTVGGTVGANAVPAPDDAHTACTASLIDRDTRLGTHYGANVLNAACTEAHDVPEFAWDRLSKHDVELPAPGAKKGQ